MYERMNVVGDLTSQSVESLFPTFHPPGGDVAGKRTEVFVFLSFDWWMLKETEAGTEGPSQLTYCH